MDIVVSPAGISSLPLFVDPSRSDSNRFGLVVLAAVATEGKDYKTYWVSREDDMENYLISPASGSVFLECFRRDGSQETKLLTWTEHLGSFA